MTDDLSPPFQGLPLRGIQVLVVEDEYYIADDVWRELKAAGADVIGRVSTVTAAQAAVHDAEFDCAVLDLNLHGESALPVAEWLMESGKPFAIATGYGWGAIPDRFKGVPRIENPFDPPALLELVGHLSGVRTNDQAV